MTYLVVKWAVEDRAHYRTIAPYAAHGALLQSPPSVQTDLQTLGIDVCALWRALCTLIVTERRFLRTQGSLSCRKGGASC